MDKQRKKYLIILFSILFLILFFFVARASFQRPKNSPTDPDADKGLIFSRLNDPNLIINRKYPECPKGMRYIPEGNFCIDIYEVTCDLDGDGSCLDEEKYGADINNNSTIGDVVYKYDQYINESGVGLGDEDGSSIENAYGFYRSYSLENRIPYTNITKAQAEASCNSSGKRLPTLYEWYLASQGTKDNNGSCNQNGSVILNTGQTNCISNNGIYDMIGNIEEFIKDVLYKGSDEKYYNKEHLISGKMDAKNKVVLISDPLCVACISMFPSMFEKIKGKKDFALFYYHFPLSSLHPTAETISKAMILAKRDGVKDIEKKVYDANFDKIYNVYKESDNKKALNYFNKTINTSYTLEDLKDISIKEDAQLANDIKLRDTPTVIFNGSLYDSRIKLSEALSK